MKKIILATGLFCSVQLMAQDKQTAQPMNWKDVATWKSFSGSAARLSPDGKWMAYPYTAVEADGELIIRKVGDTVQYKYTIGAAGFAAFQFSEDGKWLAYTEAPSYKETIAAKKTPGKELFQKMYLVELATGKKQEFDKAGQYMFNGEAANILAVVINKDKTARAATTGNDLLLLNLTTNKQQHIGNVSEFFFNKSGNMLAYAVDAAGKAANGLNLLRIPNNQLLVLDNGKYTYKSISWNEEGTAFTALKMEKDDAFKNERGAVIGVKDLTAVNPSILIFDPKKDSVGFAATKTISGNRSAFWSDDLSRVFFGINELEPVKKAPTAPAKDTTGKAAEEMGKLTAIKADTSIKNLADLKRALEKADKDKGVVAPAKNEADKPDMAIWHWKDTRLQSRQQLTERQDKTFAYWGMYDVTGKKFYQLNDSTVKTFTMFPKQEFALAEDISAYELDNSLDGQTYSDMYIIDLKNGKAKRLAEKFYQPGFTSRPSPSPDGKKIVYGEEGHYYLYDLVTNEKRNLTAELPTSFVNTEDDHNVEKPLTGIAGWSIDNKYVYLKDLWDIWQIALDGKQAPVNITQNGKQTKVRYQSFIRLDREEKGVNTTKPVYVRVYGESTKKSGYVLLSPAKNGIKPGVQQLIWDDAAVNNLTKATKANVYSYSTETFSKAPEVFVTNDPLLKNGVQQTKNTPDANKYNWSSGTRLIDYVSDKGDSLQAALFLPAGYEQGKKYPTIVYYYEKLSQTLHNYANPGYPGGGWNPSLYTSNGYAVLIPDIVYTMDDPGMSAVWCVLPAVKAAITTGVIDADKMGIHGHSWGGYQTSFLITQTNMFKAAAAGAPLTNMVSMYDLIYWNSGGGNMAIFESSQGRFKGAPWENWDSYLRNSPVYHVKKVNTPLLLLHNDKDGAVDFTQGIEYYNALRRLKKPVVMVQYKGENHGLAKLENRKDYAVRMMQFFDHHLKGAKAPEWLSNGVESLKLAEHLEETAF